MHLGIQGANIQERTMNIIRMVQDDPMVLHFGGAAGIRAALDFDAKLRLIARLRTVVVGIFTICSTRNLVVEFHTAVFLPLCYLNQMAMYL